MNRSTPSLPILQTIVLLFIYTFSVAGPNAGFYLPDSVRELELKFRSVRDLIILPVTINGTIRVNLILDTGCRNLVLFGKKFEKLLNASEGKRIHFSGLGSGESVSGRLSLNNEVSIGTITGQGMPAVVVNEKNLFSAYSDIDGIIGYDIFMKFEIEINSRTHKIKFRPALMVDAPAGFAQVPLRIVDSRPLMTSNIFFNKSKQASCELMIDTGSSLGLLLKTTDAGDFKNYTTETVIGRGLNGLLKGYQTTARKMNINGFEMTSIPLGIVESDWENHASIGMSILKDYIVVLNYCKSYACFKAFA
jgi:hypothetical protein